MFVNKSLYLAPWGCVGHLFEYLITVLRRILKKKKISTLLDLKNIYIYKEIQNKEASLFCLVVIELSLTCFFNFKPYLFM